MKRNIYFTLVVLFIFAACKPSPGGLGQADTAEQKQIPIQELTQITSSTDSPALLPTLVGGRKPATLNNYPTNSNNFINDTRDNRLKRFLLGEMVPEALEKEIALYNAEFRRMGIDPKMIEYQASIIDDNTWTLFPKNIKTKNAFIVTINGLARPCIDLNGYLDRNIEDDFFDLRIVRIPDPKLVGDQSGWHVFAEVENGNVIRWYDALHDEVIPVEIKIRNSIKSEDAPRFTEFSRVTLEDLTSGKLLELERKWLEDNPFLENANPFNGLKLVEGHTGLSTLEHEKIFEVVTKNIEFSINADYSELSTRPIKVISYYVLWDEELFEKLGITDKVLEDNYMFGVNKENRFATLGIMSWAYLNPDRSTVIGHTLISLGSSNILQPKDNTFDCPLVDIYNYVEFMPNNIITDTKSVMEIYSKFPELKPLELSKKWINSKIMPKEIENKLFGDGGRSQFW